uniref:Ymf66 n=1 Tax=Paraurostyla sp. TaxID=6014 RepID=A0A3Q8B961_9STIC|nr:hypothetical protein [Paraurostyla sp.]
MISLLIFFFLIFTNEYNWIESYLDNDILWLENSLNWENAFDLVLNEFSIYIFFSTPFFKNNHFFLDYFTKLSFIDIMLISEKKEKFFSRKLYEIFMWDILNSFNNKFFFFQFFFYSDYQDMIILLTHYSPELIFALVDYVNIYWYNKVLTYTPAIVFDSFQDSLNSSISEFIEFLFLFFIFTWIIILFINIFRILKWNNSVESYWIRIFYYLNSMSKESRTQLEITIQAFFFFFLYWTMLIATFDDDQEELIEIFNTNFFLFFCLLILILITKYSQHYFAFLEASVSEGKNVSFVFKQFFRDFINTFALFLRFFILLFRLNVYDALDDFYDSYYIFVGDFDDDEYLSESFFFLYSLSYIDSDNNDDRSFTFEDENEFLIDIYYLYFIIWGKFLTFIFFILEEILRLSLAFYICYLIIFEVHSVNNSYLEDFYFFVNKQNVNSFNKKINKNTLK